MIPLRDSEQAVATCTSKDAGMRQASTTGRVGLTVCKACSLLSILYCAACFLYSDADELHHLDYLERLIAAAPQDFVMEVLITLLLVLY